VRVGDFAPHSWHQWLSFAAYACVEHWMHRRSKNKGGPGSVIELLLCVTMVASLWVADILFKKEK
jgi:hypothetical protein